MPSGQNLLDKRDRVLAMGHSEEFLRNWQYYLESCAASFQIGHTDVVQWSSPMLNP